MSSAAPRPLGHSVRDLLLELKRGSGGSGGADGTGGAANNNYVLPAYNDVLVQTCLDEMNGHVQDLEDQANAIQQGRRRDGGSGSEKVPEFVRPSLLLQHAAIQRHKRCLLTYHQVRVNSIQDMYWQQGVNSTTTSTTDGGGNNDNNENLSPLEQEFQSQYHKLIQRFGDVYDLDLHSLPTPPLPQDRIQVRVLRDDVFFAHQGGGGGGGGEDTTTMIALESGASVSFTKGSTHYLLYSDVEEYLKQGYLELLEGEEMDV